MINRIEYDDNGELDEVKRQAKDDMWRTCLGALPDMGTDPVYPGWVLKTFMDNMLAIRPLRRDGEK